jgi:hypothetical protein
VSRLPDLFLNLMKVLASLSAIGLILFYLIKYLINEFDVKLGNYDGVLFGGYLLFTILIAFGTLKLLNPYWSNLGVPSLLEVSRISSETATAIIRLWFLSSLVAFIYVWTTQYRKLMPIRSTNPEDWFLLSFSSSAIPLFVLGLLHLIVWAVRAKIS